MGLGVGLKSICSHAFQQKNDGLIFFDQDTDFNEMTLETINHFYDKHQDMLNHSYSSVVFNSEHYSATKEIDFHNFKNVLLSRNSGSLFILKNLREINWHNEKYFVDGVDYEYNLNSKLNNFKIAQFSQTPGFDHISEQGDNGYRFLGYRLQFRRYSNSRIKDYLISSMRVLSKAAFNLQFKLFKLVFLQFIVYILTQLLIRTTPKRIIRR
jgi:rhamnosyltransferase